MWLLTMYSYFQFFNQIWTSMSFKSKFNQLTLMVITGLISTSYYLICSQMLLFSSLDFFRTWFTLFWVLFFLSTPSTLQLICESFAPYFFQEQYPKFPIKGYKGLKTFKFPKSKTNKKAWANMKLGVQIKTGSQ